MTVINNPPLDLTFKEVVEYHGLRCRGLVRPRTIELLQTIINDLERSSHLRPEIAYNIVPVTQVKDGCLYLANHKILPVPLTTHKLRHISHLLVGVCTLGDQVGPAISQLFRNKKRLAAVLMEELANHALFKLSGMLELLADQDAKEIGLTASSRLNPGDNGFDLSLQSAIVEMAGASRIKVDVNVLQMMSPQHSISVIFGLGKNMPKWNKAQSCKSCRAYDRCRYRIAAEETI